MRRSMKPDCARQRWPIISVGIGTNAQAIREAKPANGLDSGPEMDRFRRAVNVRNGSYLKRVRTEVGEVTVQVSRDRQGSFEPATVYPGRRRGDGGPAGVEDAATRTRPSGCPQRRDPPQDPGATCATPNARTGNRSRASSSRSTPRQLRRRPRSSSMRSRNAGDQVLGRDQVVAYS